MTTTEEPAPPSEFLRVSIPAGLVGLMSIFAHDYGFTLVGARAKPGAPDVDLVAWPHPDVVAKTARGRLTYTVFAAVWTLLNAGLAAVDYAVEAHWWYWAFHATLAAMMATLGYQSFLAWRRARMIAKSSRALLELLKGKVDYVD